MSYAVLTPPEVAKRWRIKPERVLRMIRRGELRAFDVGEPGRSRPRFRVPVDAMIEYENRRAPIVATPQRQRRKAEGGFVEFFK